MTKQARKVRQKLDEEMRESFQRWNHIIKNGCQDPLWEDGINLNLVRNHIIDYRRQCEEQLDPQEYPECYQWDLPPRVHPRFMVDADGIMEDASKVLKMVLKHPDYLWLLDYRSRYHGKNSDIKRKLDTLRYVDSLKGAIEKENFPYMRRFRDPDYLINQFRDAKKKVQEIDGDVKKVPTGQLSIFDFI